MTPQKENGYTAIANEIMDALAKYRIPGEQMQCLLFILRKTYGYNKKTDSIALSQFVKGTGIKRPNVSRALKILSDKKLIYIQKGGIKKDTITISKYRFNKRYKSWLIGIKKDTTSIKKDNKVLSKKIHTKDILTKDKELYTSNFKLFWEKYPKKIGKGFAFKAYNNIKGPKPSLNKILSSIENNNSSEQWQNKQFIPNPATWLNQRRWEDEPEPINGNDWNPPTQEEIDKQGEDYLS